MKGRKCIEAPDGGATVRGLNQKGVVHARREHYTDFARPGNYQTMLSPTRISSDMISSGGRRQRSFSQRGV
jgi:hypothetical protein